jgi:hypothetical protein
LVLSYSTVWCSFVFISSPFWMTTSVNYVITKSNKKILLNNWIIFQCTENLMNVRLS